MCIAVKDIEETLKFYGELFGLEVSGNIENIEDQSVKAALVRVGGSQLEFIQPTDPDGPIAKFIKDRGEAVHHLCFEVKNIIIARDHLISNGARVLGDGIPKLGAHDKPVLFLHPKDFSGTLIELEEL